MINFKKMPAALLLLLLFLLASAVSCREATRLPVREITVTKKDGSQVRLQAEIAAEPEDRDRGYMERTHIPDGTGMLFIFDRDQVLSFWMKNTPSPLSIAYIDSQGVICDIFDMEPYSLSSTTSTRSLRYALEVPQGWFERAGIGRGDRISIPESL